MEPLLRWTPLFAVLGQAEAPAEQAPPPQPSGFAARLPPVLTETRFLEVALWEWIALALLLVAGYVVACTATALLIRLLRPLVTRSRTQVDDRILVLTRAPLRLLATVGIFSAGVRALALDPQAQELFHGVSTVVAVIGVAWLCFAAIDVVSMSVSEEMRSRGRSQATYLLPLGGRMLKAIAAVVVLLAGLDNLGVDVTAIVAGLGVGGLAVALALQPTLENVFGGVVVLVDQPVKPGELCSYGNGQTGTVEEIGLRSTRVRSPDRTVVSIPNGVFANLQIENFARRDRFRLQTLLGLRYETSADQLRHVLAELRRLMHSHPRVLREGLSVRFVAFGASSLDVELTAFVDTDEPGEFAAIREDILLRTMGLVEASGSGFAFPSTTAYLARDQGLDADKKQAAEQQVAAWRERGQLAFPDFDADTIEGLRSSLPYPPEGSALARGG